MGDSNKMAADTEEYAYKNGAHNSAPDHTVDFRNGTEGAYSDEEVLDAEFIGSDADEPPHYLIPDSLVKRTYAPVEVRSIVTERPLRAQIVLPAPAAEQGAGRYSLAAYEDALAEIAGQFPLRVARLKDLYERVQAVRQNWLKLQEREEQVRVDHNQLAQVINERVERELSDLRKQWEAQRQKRQKLLQELEAAKAKREAEIAEAVDDAWKAYWDTRDAAAAERDKLTTTLSEQVDAEAKRVAEQAEKEAARQLERRQAEADAEKEKRRQRDAEREATLRKRCEELAKEAAAAERAAEDAERELYDRRVATLESGDSSLTATRDAYYAALQRAADVWNTRRQDAESEASASLGELLSRRELLRQELHDANSAAAAETARREDACIAAKQQVAAAAARAGLHPGETAGDIAAALRAKLSEDAKTAGLAGVRHLMPKRDHPVVRILKAAGAVLATVVCGLIFGISLGLVTHVLPPSLNLLLEEPAKPAGVGVLGIFLFWLIGGLVEKATAHASEDLHADAEREERTGVRSNRGLLSAGLAGGVLAVLIAIEATVERYGIVNIASTMNTDAFGQQASSTTADQVDQVAYWVLALVASVPFVLFHAYHGAMEVRYRVSARRIAEHSAEREQEYLHRPQVAAVSEAIEHAARLDEAFTAWKSATPLAVQEAERRLAESEREIESHPITRATREAVAGPDDDAEYESLAEVQAAARIYDELKQALEADPRIEATRARAEKLRRNADEAVAEAQKAADEFCSPWRGMYDAARSVAHGVVHGAGEAIHDSLSEAANIFTGQAGEAVGQVTGASLIGQGLGHEPALPALLLAKPIAQIAWEVAMSAADAVRNGVSAHSLPETDAERTASDKLTQARNLLRDDAESGDQQLLQLRGRIRALKKAMANSEEIVRNRAAGLRRQRRKEMLELSDDARRRIQDAYDQLASAQALFEEELLMLERLVATPRLLRSFVAWRQTHADRAPVLRQIRAAEQQMPAAKALPAPLPPVA